MNRSCLTLLGLVSFGAAAQPIEPTLLGGSPEARVRLDEVAEGLEERFKAVLASYDDEIAAQPHRARARIARCEFIDAFALEYEYVTFSDSVYELSERCEQELAGHFPDHPDVRLWQLSRTYGDEERFAAAEALVPFLDMHGWTRGQRARLYTELATVSERLDVDLKFRERTARFARYALELDVRADVRLILAAYHQGTGDDAAALEVLTSPFDGHDAKDAWYAVRKMTYLAELGARDAVVAVHATLDGATYYDRSEAAAALRAVGEHELARQELDNGAEASYLGPDHLRQRFVMALETGTAADAHAAYEQWRDLGWEEDPIGVNRFALFVAHPSLPWRWRDVWSVAGAAAYLATLCLLWCLPLGLIHYRGLANRLRTGAAGTDGVQLRHAWWGLAAFMLASFVSLYAVGPLALFEDAAMPWAIAAEQPQLAKAILVESVVAVLLLGIVARSLQRHFGRWWSTDWSVAKCLLIGTAVGLAFRLPLIGMLASGVDLSRFPIDNSMLELLREVHRLYGPAAALWVLVAAAPVAEEFLFRGLLLRASLRHISFPAANLVQAALFSALHLDLAAAPYLFACGLAFGWLARRSGGLLAPMAAHAIFNLLAAFLVMA